MLHVREESALPFAAFRDRADAGRQLAAYITEEDGRADLVAAIPSGGVAVARPMLAPLDADLDLVFVKKLPFPASPEAGFGAVTLEGDLEMNERWEHAVSDEEVSRIAKEVLASLRDRENLFMEGRQHPHVDGRRVVLVDDGLASGYTMMAAVKQFRHKGPTSLAVAVPDAPMSTIRRVEPLVDDLYVLVAQRGGAFAVASYYARWHDLSDGEVLDILNDCDGERRDARR